jgi:hypothetical protein
MKDLDKMLSNKAPKPQKELSTNFTEKVVSELHDNPKVNWFQRTIESLHLQHVSKLGFAVFAAFVVLSSTAAAIALWPTASVKTITSFELPNGNRIIGINTVNCQYYSDLDGTATGPTNENAYYEVRKGSNLTDEQIKVSVQGMCEENITNNAISRIFNELPKDIPNIQSTQAYIVDAITEDSVTLTLDPHYEEGMYTTKSGLTYTNFAKDLLVYDNTTKIDFSDIKIGDSIKMVVQDTSGINSETTETYDYNPINNPETITVLAILKIPALTSNPDTLMRAVATDIVRTEPCTTDPSGFCRAYDFVETE